MKKKIMLLGLFVMIFATNAYGRFRLGHYHCYREDSITREEYNKEKHELMIFIEEKNLEIEKEILKENPDWDKIEKLNDEIEKKSTKFKTHIIKEQHKKIHKKVEK